jgi:hypothetical protein
MAGAVCVLFRLVDSRFARGLVSVAVLVVLCAMAGPAAASTAQLVEVVHPPYCKYSSPGVPPCVPTPVNVLVYQGAPGEANAVSVTGTREEVRIVDRAAVIEPGPGCTRIEHHSVRCTELQIDLIQNLLIATADGADVVRLGTSELGQVIIDGGRGDDLLVGNRGPEALYAGRGDDFLRGRGGDDQLHDASPRRALRSGDPSPFAFEGPPIALADPGRGRDTFDGGAGPSDTVSYAARSAALRIDLGSTAAIGGARGERDSVRGVENASGGTGDDRLTGGPRSDQLDGGEGDDVIAGRGGGDTLTGGSGRDTARGGPGGDSMFLYHLDEDPERIFCGSGLDNVSWIFPTDFLNDDCEHLTFPGYVGERLGGGVRSLLPLRAGRPPTVLSATLTCYSSGAPNPCPLEMEVRVVGAATRRGTAPPAGTLLGSISHTFPVGEEQRVRLDLSPAGVGLLRRHRALRVSVTTSGQPPDGPAGYLTVLRAP